jgi:hypothetical protein
MHASWSQHVKKGKIYNVLSDKYVSPKDFTPWNNIVLPFATAGDPKVLKSVVEQGDSTDLKAVINCGHAADIAGALDAPAVYVERALAEAVLHTDVSAMERPHTVLPVFFICLPCGLLYDDEGLNITSLLVVENLAFIEMSATFNRISKERKDTLYEDAKEAGHLRHLRIFAVNNMGSVITTDTGWDEDTIVSDVNVDNIQHNGPELRKDVFLAVLTKMRRVVKNIILIYNYQRDLVEHVTVTTGRGFSLRPKSKTRSPLPTAVLGRNFLAKKTRTSVISAKTGIRLRPHWRKGHWHTVLTGAGRKERKLRWFQPVYVNPTLDT